MMHSEITLWPNYAAFYHRYHNKWEKTEAEHLPFLRRPSPKVSQQFYISVEHERHISLEAILTPEDQILISAGERPLIEALGRYLNSLPEKIPGIFGPSLQSKTLANLLTQTHGTHYTVAKQLYHMSLQSFRVQKKVSGLFRQATELDTKILIAHRKAFQIEENTLRSKDADKAVTQNMQNKELFVIENTAGEIVCSGAIDWGRTAQADYLHHIYTAPKWRRLGYGSLLVSELCTQILARKKLPRLSVDIQNKAALKAYHQIGFATDCTMTNLRETKAKRPK